MGTKRAVVYCRISKDRTGSMAGVQRQEHDCRELVNRQGWTLVGVFTDDDTSAYSGTPRPAYAQVLDLAGARRVDVLVAWHPDRITRNPRELEDLIDVLDASHCQVETVRGGRVDLSTRSGRTTARLIGAVARDESEAKAEPLQAMHADRARRGLFSGGPRPYGYMPNPDGTMSIVEPEAEVIREVATRVIGGEWVGTIAHDLNQRGVPTIRGGTWRTQTLRRLVTSHTVGGRREHHGTLVDAAWPAILDSATWRQTNARIKDPSRARGVVARVALLAGIARCGKCDEKTKLMSQRRANGRRVMVCPARSLGGCGGVQVSAEPLERHVEAEFLAELDQPAFRAALATGADPTGRRDAIATELAGLDTQSAELGRMWRRKVIDSAGWQAALVDLEAEREALNLELAQLTEAASAVDIETIVKDWPYATFHEKRYSLNYWLEDVTVAPTTPGPRFNTDRVSLNWRERQ